MLLAAAIGKVRNALDDTGVFLTHFAAVTAASLDSTVPIASAAGIVPGLYVTIGTPSTVEGHLVVAVDAALLTMTVVPPLAKDFPAYTPIGIPALHDETIALALESAVQAYSAYKPYIAPLSLSLAIDQGSYDLPADFLAPVVKTFDAALGLTSSPLTTGAYYALIYAIDSRMSAVPMGFQTGFASGYPYPYAALAGSPAAQPVTQRTFTFQNTNPRRLLVDPAPTVAQDVSFQYRALHTLPAVPDPSTSAESTIPVEDQYLLPLHATWTLAQALATGKAAVLKYELNGEKIDNSKAPDVYRSIAKDALTEWEKALRFIGHGSMG